MAENGQEIQQEMQQKLILYQLFSQRLEQLNEQARLIEQRLLEVETTRQALGDLKGLKDGNEVLIPLGSGCYAHGRTGDSGLLMDMGAGVMLEKTPEEAGKIMEGKRQETEKFSLALQSEVSDVVNRMNQLGPELQRFLQKPDGSGPEAGPEDESAGAG